MYCPHCGHEKIKGFGNIKLFTDTAIGMNEYIVTGWQCLKCKLYFYLDSTKG